MALARSDAVEEHFVRGEGSGTPALIVIDLSSCLGTFSDMIRVLPRPPSSVSARAAFFFFFLPDNCIRQSLQQPSVTCGAIFISQEQFLLQKKLQKKPKKTPKKLP